MSDYTSHATQKSKTFSLEFYTGINSKTVAKKTIYRKLGLEGLKENVTGYVIEISKVSTFFLNFQSFCLFSRNNFKWKMVRRDKDFPFFGLALRNKFFSSAKRSIVDTSHFYMFWMLFAVAIYF